MTAGRMARLKARTQAVHRRLHEEGPFAAIARGRAGEAEVALALALHCRCWSAFLTAPAEAQCRAVFGTPPRLLFDLPALERACGGRTWGGRTWGGRALASNRAEDDAHLLGAAYVYLGSKKGGRLLARRLRDSGAETAAQAFAPGPEDEARWSLLSEAVEDLGPKAFDSVLATAIWCFEQFQPPGAVGTAAPRSELVYGDPVPSGR